MKRSGSSLEGAAEGSLSGWNGGEELAGNHAVLCLPVSVLSGPARLSVLRSRRRRRGRGRRRRRRRV